MKKSRFTDSQIMSILKQAEAGTPVAELCREHGMSNASFYKWRSRFGGMDASMMTRLKELEEENRPSKKCMLKSVSRPKLFRKPWQKSGEAIASKADGARSRQEPKRQRAFCLPAVCCQRKLLSLPAATK
ncbi:transposase [Gibbsiella quercinecans]|nr:transposase [Gibbsiella quercinecans]